MNQRITQKDILELIKKNEGLNIYQLTKLTNVSYSTLHRHLNLMESMGLIKFKEEIIKLVKKVYLK